MLVEFLILAGALYVGFTIGGNDTANCIGACVGGGVLSLRSAVIIGATFAFLGGIIGGSGVTETIANDIISPSDLTPMMAATCLLATGLMVTFATLRGMPVSTSHAIIMGLVGAGLAASVNLNSARLASMTIAWIVVPITMVPLSLCVFSLLSGYLSRISSILRFEIILKYLLIFSAMYASFALGANHAGLAGGMLEGAGILGRLGSGVIGSLAISAGMLLLSGRVVKTIGSGITSLDPISAFSMQISAALGLTACSLLGIPISSSQTIVAAAIGVGLARGGGGIDHEQVSIIGAYWVIIPVATMIITFVLLSFIG